MTGLTSSDFGSTSSQNGFQQVPSAFMSTYNKEYTGAFGLPAPNARVRTSRFYPPGQPDVDSTYRTHFVFHQNKSRIQVPYGTSSGCRSNNPHPHNMEQVFNHPTKGCFVWSHYRKLPPVTREMYAVQGSSSSELLRKVCQENTRTIYQQDYVPPLQDLSSSLIGTDDGSSRLLER